MALTRIPIPSPCYSSRGGSGTRLIVIHTAEGSRTIESLGNWFANPNNQVSSHAGADDKAYTIGVYVHREDKAWTQADANPSAVSLELCGFASWPADEWHRHPNMLENCARWIAEEAAAFGIPVRRLSPDQAQSGAAGVCQHRDLGAWGGNHSDCGNGFPFDEVLAMAGGVPGEPVVAPPPALGTAPPWPGVYLDDYTEDPSAATWQAQMAARGWSIAVDGAYGPQSAWICQMFQDEKGLDVDGVVGPVTWEATWEAPVT